MAQGGLTDGQLTAKPKIIVSLIIYGFMMFFLYLGLCLCLFCPRTCNNRKKPQQGQSDSTNHKTLLSRSFGKVGIFLVFNKFLCVLYFVHRPQNIIRQSSAYFQLDLFCVLSFGHKPQSLILSSVLCAFVEQSNLCWSLKAEVLCLTFGSIILSSICFY